MLKIKNVLMGLTVFCFSLTSLSAKQTDVLKIMNLHPLTKTKHQIKKNKQEKKSKKTKFERTKKRSKINTDIKTEYQNVNSNYDINICENEMVSEIYNSKFGYELSLKNKKLLDAVVDFYQLFISDIDIEDEGFFEEIQSYFPDMEKFNSILEMIYLQELSKAEYLAMEINSTFFKNIGLELLFDYYIQKKQPQNAQRIFSEMVFESDEDEEDDLICEEFSFVNELIITYLQNKDFETAEKLADTFDNIFYRNKNFFQIAKYYTRLNDIDNAKRIINKMDDSQDAHVLLLDLYARQKNMVEFQKLASSINSIEFQRVSKMILAIYQNDLSGAYDVFKEGFGDFTDYYYMFDNIIEILCSTNQIKQAEAIVNLFADDFEATDYKLFFVNCYLKNSNFEEARRVCNEIDSDDDFFEKWMAAKLIAIYENK